MHTDPDGLPARADRLKMADALRSILEEEGVADDADLAAAVGAMAASRYFGVRFRAEGNPARAWVARRPNPDIHEVWEPLASGLLWDFQARLPVPSDYEATACGVARIGVTAQGRMAEVSALAKLVQARALGVDPDDVW